MKFSAVIVNYQSWQLTLRCIESLQRTGREDLEILVVDNEAGAYIQAPELPHPARRISNLTNVGFARACNQGIAASRGDLVVLINPDTLVERDFFGRLEEFFEENPKAGVAGPKVLDGNGNLQLSARRELGFVSGLLGRTSFLTRLFPRSRVVRRMFPAAQTSDGPAEVDWVSGACLAVRRRTLEEIGAMDERFFMYFEDADLCRRAREAGHPVYYLPRVEVVHLTGASSRSRPRAIWRLHKSAFLYHRKHGPHGPLNLYSGLVLLGLGARGLAKLAAMVLAR
ncbi:MAG: glycosyltransferase family 2 protein [Rubrobacteraceae bacterium]